MSTLIILLLCGAAGGFIFEWFGLPGGAMTGAIIAVILLKSFSSLPQAAFPRPFQFCIYAGLGVLVGNMYRPEMLLAVRDTWPVLVISTLLVLVAGMLIAIFVVKFGNLDVTSAYLATSPERGGRPCRRHGPQRSHRARLSNGPALHHHPYGSPRRPDFAQIPELRREKRKRKGRFEGPLLKCSERLPRGFQCRKTQGIPFRYIHESVPGRPFSRRLDEGIRKRVLSHHRAPKPLATVIY